jgi:hypothetical protein
MLTKGLLRPQGIFERMIVGVSVLHIISRYARTGE